MTASVAPNHLPHGLILGRRMAGTRIPQMRVVRMRSAQTCPASSDLPRPKSAEIWVAAAIWRKEPNARPVLSKQL